MIRPAAFVLATVVVFGLYLRRSPERAVSHSTVPSATPEVTTVEVPSVAAGKVVEQSSIEAMERYQQCVDAILTGKNSAGCEKKKSPSDRMLYIVIGDSTARKHAKGVNEDFPDLKFNGSRLTFPMGVTGKHKVGKKKVELTVTMFAGLRHSKLQDDLLQKIQDHVDDVGVEPSVVVFSGLGLHECMAAKINKHPFWVELLKKRNSEVTLPRWKAEAVTMKTYHRLEEPCSLSVLKELRLAFPKTIFLWRPVLHPAALFMGSKYDPLTDYKCRNRWHKLAQACGDTRAWHMQLKPKLREFGFGFLDYASVFPEKCGLHDQIHLSTECHDIMTKRTMEVSQLVVPDPELYLDRNEIKAEMAKSCPLDKQLEMIDDVKPATFEDATVLQLTPKRWFNVRCADYLNNTVPAYDPLTGEFFKPTKEEIEVGHRVPKEEDKK